MKNRNTELDIQPLRQPPGSAGLYCLFTQLLHLLGPDRVTYDAVVTIESARVVRRAINSPRHVLFASLIGTTIEFFDFYIYATAAVLVFPKLFFPASDPASATLASLATFAHRVSRAAHRLGAVRPLRRSHRPQDDARGRAADDGGVDGVDRPAADVQLDRHRGAAAARAVPIRPGPRARRRMGRRGAAGGRERAAGQARVVRDVSAARRADRLRAVGRHLPGALRAASPTSSSSDSAGGCRFSPARRSCSSACTCG